MNNLVLASLVAALGVTGVTQTAKAGHDETVAAIGGFIGGVIVGSAIHDHGYGPPPYRDRVVVVDRYDRRGGYWDYITVRTWVPGRWFFAYDNCGRRVRTWEPGHYNCRQERVWVDARRDRHHDYDRRYRD